MTSTRDGHWLFQAEGGEMAFLDTFDENILDYSEDGFITAAKRVQVGARGVIANRMLLDPDANDMPVENDREDLLYIAGGRDGLWIMEAFVDGNVKSNRAWRVDDSGNINNNIQNSKRWCSDVDVMRVQGVDYLLALFSRKDQSRLRAYKLDDVRDIWDLTGELGHELTAMKQVKLNVHPSPGMPPTAPSFGRSVALSMTVDQSGELGTEVADVYVAMGHHGIVKVQFSGPTLSAQRTWGPVFGNGTPYASIGSALLPPGKTENLYLDLEYELVRKFHETRVIERQEAPVFTDVAVYSDDPVNPAIHHLYATVDHLFWLVFDLKNETFGPSMPILHHEGRQISVFPGDPGLAKASVETVEPVDMQGKGGAARSLKIVQHPDGPMLVVTSNKRSFLKDFFMTSTEGLTWDYSFGWGGGFAVGPPSKTQLFWYKIQATYPGTFNAVDHAEFGGQHLHLPEVQEVTDKLKIFHNIVAEDSSGNTVNGVCLTLVSLLDPGGNPPAPVSYTRNQRDAIGRYTFNAVSALLDPNLILTGKNDGGVPRDGFLVMGKGGGPQYQVKTYYDPNLPDPSDDRGPDGIIVGPASQWQQDATLPTHQFVWAAGSTKDPVLDPDTRGRWLLLDLEVPTDTLTVSPDRSKAVYFLPPKDGFVNRGRASEQTASMSLEFDAFLDGLGGHPERFQFGVYPKSAEALWVMFRDEILALALVVDDGKEVDLDTTPGFTKTSLVTHPEFNRMPRGVSQLINWWGAGGKQDHHSLIYNWAPIMVSVKDKGTQVFGSWVLVAPCGWIAANEDWDIYDDDPLKGGNHTWYPIADIWKDNYTSGLIQFWKMAPPVGNPTGAYAPETITQDNVPGNSPLRKIVGQPKGNFWKLDSIRIGDEVFLVAADFGGRVSIYEISGVLDWDDDPDKAVVATALVAEYQTPQSLFDDLTTPVFDIAVDYRGGSTAIIYVAALRVGVRLLKFDPSLPVGSKLTEMTERLQAIEYATGVHVRVNRDDTRNLVVSYYSGGIHVYE